MRIASVNPYFGISRFPSGIADPGQASLRPAPSAEAERTGRYSRAIAATDSRPRPRCYVASPLGFNDAGRDYYRRTYLPALAEVVDVVDPWALASDEELRAIADDSHARTLGLDLGRRNATAIRSCTLLVAWLDGQEVDSGTAAEVGYAAALGLRCLGVRSDLRRTGERGMRVNLQVEAFVVESGGEVVASLDELVAWLGTNGSHPGKRTPDSLC